jgi:hypothetical protein
VLDWRGHAIDERGDHPIGVYRAQCGHLLTVVTELFEPPNAAPFASGGKFRPTIPRTCVRTGERCATALTIESRERWGG